MDMKLEDIKGSWLLNAQTGYSDEEVLKGFSTVETLLGSNFIEERWKGQRGVVIVNQIVSLGLNLGDVSKIKGFSKLKKRLLGKNDFNIIISELSCAAFFARKKQLIELYPSNPDKEGELEMRLRVSNKDIVYVEVVSPKTHVWNNFLLKVIEPLKKITAKMEDIRLEIYFYEILRGEALEELFETCKEIVKKGQLGSEIYFKGKYHLFLSHADTIKINTAEIKTEEQTSLFVTTMRASNGHTSLITVAVPFADLRASWVLKKEYHQLTENFPNVVVIDASGVPKANKNWPAHIRRRFQPKINRKISAVLLCNSVNSQKIETERKWIVNPCSKYKIPDEIIESELVKELAVV